MFRKINERNAEPTPCSQLNVTEKTDRHWNTKFYYKMNSFMDNKGCRERRPSSLLMAGRKKVVRES